MRTTTPDPGSSGRSTISSVRQRRYLLYFVLAAFDVFAVSVSLYLNHRIMSIYQQSVEVNHQWAESTGDTSCLGQLAAAINAPGNNVFESRQVEAESAKMREAVEKFADALAELKGRLINEAASPWTAPLLRDLDRVESATLEMTGEAEKLFAAFRADQPTEAGQHMARMDRRFDDANVALFRLRDDIAMIQREIFANQTASAASLQRSEYIIGGLILLMVCGATYFGYQTARQEEADAQERDRGRKRKQALEVRTRVLKQVMAAQEEERRRIARDLHDEIGQCLTSLLIGLRTVESAGSLDQAQAHAEELRRVASSALDEVKRMARGLRPSVLDDVGLAAALERLTDDFANANEIKVDLSIGGLENQRLPETVETALYRISQEALTNIARHAAAQQVWVRLKHEDGLVEMSVADDGCGFDCRGALAERGLGLSGMRERAALLEGAITIESKPGAGTWITVRIPLGELAHDEDARARGG